jgi:hypothetical protein
VACRQGEYQEPRALLVKSLARCRKTGERRLIVECLEGFADLAEGEMQPTRAVQLLGAAASLRRILPLPMRPSMRAHYDPQIERLRAYLGEPAFTTAWEAGLNLTWQQATDYALEAAASTE